VVVRFVSVFCDGQCDVLDISPDYILSFDDGGFFNRNALLYGTRRSHAPSSQTNRQYGFLECWSKLLNLKRKLERIGIRERAMKLLDLLI